MGSPCSNVNSDCFPVDHESVELEMDFGSLGNKKEANLSFHIETDPINDDSFLGNAGGLRTEPHFRSSSGGIPLEHVVVEDDVSSEEGLDDTASKHFKENQAIKAAFDISKHERKELTEARVLVMELQSYMESKGFSMAAFEKEKLTKSGEFNVGLPKPTDLIVGRDEFGLPILKNHQAQAGIGPSGVKDARNKDKSPITNVQKSWTNVVRETNTHEEKLQYHPPISGTSEGTPVIKPSKDFLLSGHKAWNTSLVGYFIGSQLPFKMVEEEARKLWLRLGFVKLYVVKKGFYVFKFNTEIDRNKILASGPWHFKRNQIILEPWFEGKKLQKSGFSKLPIWVKIHDIPFSYWTTRDGLARVASGVGVPIQLDPVTAKLEPMPYAKVLVEAQANVPLPAEISITVLHGDGVTESLMQSKVEYFNKPAQCSKCKVFGHSISRCPHSPTTWIKKNPSLATQTTSQTHSPVVPITVEHVKDHVEHVKDPCIVECVQKDPASVANLDTSGIAVMSPDNSTPPIPTSGIISRLKHVDEIVKLKGILKPSLSGNTRFNDNNLQAGTSDSLSPPGTKNKLDPDGFETVVSKKTKKNKGLSPKVSSSQRA